MAVKGGNVFTRPSVCRILTIGILLGTLIFAFKSLTLRRKAVKDVAVIEILLKDVMKGHPIHIQLPQDDLRIKTYIEDYGYIQPPSVQPYNLEKPDKDPSMGQGQMVRKILQNMTDGFFVECGASDGETRSNSLYFEKELGWKGLLIEADPLNYQVLLSKNRKSWTSNSCLATQPYPHEVVFNVGKVSDYNTDVSISNPTNLVKVQCFPLYSLLNALGVQIVDYFSLDVEGNELQVLQNIPFDLLFIKVLSVGNVNISREKEVAAMKEFMESKGYAFAGEIANPQELANDFIFVHESLKHFVPEESSEHEIVSTSSLPKYNGVVFV